MSRSFRSTVECYDCRQQVTDLKAHRSVCVKHKATTMECYDCHQQVTDLKNHRKICLRKDVVVMADNTKDVYFLIDVSGSMAGFKLDQSKETVTSIFSDMNEKDRLAIVAFDSGAFFKLRPRPVGQVRRQNELPELLSKMFAKGNTAIYDAIWISVEQIQDKNRSTLMIVITDGEDNSSKHTLAEVMKMISEYPKIQLDIVQIDSQRNPNYEQLAQGRGSYSVIQEIEIQTTVKKIVTKYYA